MTITLYNNSADTLHVDKTSYLSNAYTMNGTPTIVPQDVKAPVLDVEFDSAPRYNYAHIPEFSRYYYINNIEWLGGNVWRLFLAVDVLMSFKSQILATNAVVSRLEDKGLEDNYFIDDRLTAQASTYEDTDIKLMTPTNSNLSFDIGTNLSGRFIAFTAAQTSASLLTSLTLSRGSLSPSFSSRTLVYNISLPAGGKLTITANPRSSIAVVRFYDGNTGDYLGAGGTGTESYTMNVATEGGKYQSVRIQVAEPTAYATSYILNIYTQEEAT